jgi:hypothetical protein
MNGLSKQLQLLDAALQPLDLHQATTEDSGIVSELQVTLARATALARWALISQQMQRSTKDATADGGDKENSCMQNETTGKTDVPHKGETTAVPQSAPAQRCDETLLSVATTLAVPVAELRRWNPQLPQTLRETDVLPPNTYLKVRQSAPSFSTGTLQRQQERLPSVSLKSPAATQTVPRLAAPSSATASSRSAVRSSSGRGSEQPNQPHITGSVSAPQTRPSVTSVSSNSTTASTTAANPPTTVNVNASVNSNLSGSVGRLSLWAGESGRGASRSPQVPEPSMPGAYAGNEPPTCAPVPVMLGMVEVLSPPSAAASQQRPSSCQLNAPDNKEAEEAAASPSPERQLPEEGEAGTSAHHPQPPPLAPPMPELSTSPSPASAAVSSTEATDGEALHALPGVPQQLQQPDVENSAGRSPRRASMGASSSGTSAREIRTRGRSQSLSNSPTARSTERQSLVSTPRQQNRPANATLSSKSAAVSASVPDAASASSMRVSNTISVTSAAANLDSALDERAGRRRLAPDALVDASEDSASSAHREVEGEVAVKRAPREPSVSLSAVSVATSTGDERDGSAPRADERNTPHAPLHRANSPVFVTSPSLEAPSSASSVSSANMSGRPPQQQQQQQRSSPYPNIPSLAESAKAAAAAAAVAATTSTTHPEAQPAEPPTRPGFSTPIQQQQQRQRRPPQASSQGTVAVAVNLAAARLPAATAQDPSCSPVSPSSCTSSTRGSEKEEESEQDDVDATATSSGGGLDHNEVEDTPSTRIPAVLGRHVCNPPPTLSRTRSLSATATSATTSSGNGADAVAKTKAREPVAVPPATPPSPLSRRVAAVATESTAAAGSSPEKAEEPAQHSPSKAAVSPFQRIESPRQHTSPSGGRVEEIVTRSNDEAQSPKLLHHEASQEATSAADGADGIASGAVVVDGDTEQADRYDDEEPRGSEDEDEYDTLEGIAAAYKLTVATIVEWNPYLKKYRPSEPLPPDLPIVLPMSDNDEEAGEEGQDEVEGDDYADMAGGVEGEEEEEDELYSEESRRQLRFSGTPLDKAPSPSEDSPAPIPPIH